VAYVETEVGNCEGSIIGWMYEHGDAWKGGRVS